MTMLATLHKARVEQIVAALPHPTTGGTRRFLRWTFGFEKYRGRRQFLIRYTWTKPYAGMTARLYSTVVGIGEDFESALEDAKSMNTGRLSPRQP